MAVENEIEQLRAEVAALRRELAERPSPQPAQPPQPAEPAEDQAAHQTDGGTLTGRRDMFKKAGLVAAGAIGGTVLGSTKPAAAADPNDVVKGQVNNVTARTEVRYTGSTALNQSILTVQDATFGTTSRAAAVAGWAGPGDGVTNGVYGWTNDRVDDNINTGHALLAYRQSGGRSHLYMKPSGGDPRNDTYVHTIGEQRQDTSGNLWHCTSSFPSPGGTWKKVSGPSTAGSFHFLFSPVRAYDSRPSQGGPGPLSAGETRTVSTAGGGGVSTDATGVVLNFTIVTPSAAGFAVVWAANLSQPTVSSINYAAGDIVGNNVLSRVDDSRQVNVFSLAETHVVMDVVGYFE